MKPKSIKHRLATLTACVAVAGGTLLTGAGQASATDTNINYWSTDSYPVRCQDPNDPELYLCLYYNSWAEGGIAGEDEPGQNVLSGTFSADQYGSAGSGQSVVDNAASAENATPWTIAICSQTYGNGDCNLLSAGKGGNLRGSVYNGEKSWGLVQNWTWG